METVLSFLTKAIEGAIAELRESIFPPDLLRFPLADRRLSFQALIIGIVQSQNFRQAHHLFRGNSHFEIFVLYFEVFVLPMNAWSVFCAKTLER